MSLGHEGVLTTLVSYGSVDSRRQAEIMREFAKPNGGELTKVEEIAKAIVREMKNQK